MKPVLTFLVLLCAAARTAFAIGVSPLVSLAQTNNTITTSGPYGVVTNGTYISTIFGNATATTNNVPLVGAVQLVAGDLVIITVGSQGGGVIVVQTTRPAVGPKHSFAFGPTPSLFDNAILGLDAGYTAFVSNRTDVWVASFHTYTTEEGPASGIVAESGSAPTAVSSILIDTGDLSSGPYWASLFDFDGAYSRPKNAAGA